ncbi:MAG: carbamoyltransferase HypF [bacterium]|nr:carbamoyltransferase HypF [bacterium]
MNKIRYSVQIEGVVQGVGFRPYFYQLAIKHHLVGFVRNDSSGVVAEIEGTIKDVECFIKELKQNPPPASRIDQVQLTKIELQNEHEFQIVFSQNSGSQTTFISPDIALCSDCEKELYQNTNFRYLYPFINCTNCGPRFTIVYEVPYDRISTTMNRFPMCSRCKQEYHDPLNRRFHAEPIACPECGPHLEWIDLEISDQFTSSYAKTVISRATKLLWQGKILALKGLGGFHLACLATDSQSVQQLRKRKKRPYKPFAVMFRDLTTLKHYCEVNSTEEKWLLSQQKPILLLKKKLRFKREEILFEELSELVAPNLHFIGAMLPYTPLHSLLFELGGFPALIMTSGNQSEEPIEIDNSSAVNNLSSIADGFLLHNRDIWNRCDDSVGYLFQNQLVLTRRSRGFTPLPISYPKKLFNTFAVGAMYSNTFAIAKENNIYLSQHIGDVDNDSTLEFLDESFQKLSRWLRIQPEIIAYDLHPDLFTTRYSKNIFLDVPHIGIQHHQAHFASVLVSHGYYREAIGVIFDGTGYGLDGMIWGGEFFFGDFRSIRRIGHFEEMPLLGGDASIRNPYRIATGYYLSINPDFTKDSFVFSTQFTTYEFERIQHFIQRPKYYTLTTSVGRLFDAVSSFLGICFVATYEGQAAIELEQVAWRYYEPSKILDKPLFHLNVTSRGETWVIEIRTFLLQLYEAYHNQIPIEKIAFEFHRAISNCTLEIIDLAIEQYGRVPVALGGGVFQNRLILELLLKELQRRNLLYFFPNEIPVNDGGLALGQVVLANEFIRQ